MPTSTSPVAVYRSTVPLPSSPTRMSPLSVLALTAARATSTVMWPLAEFARRSPTTSPTQLSPPMFLTTAPPSTWRTRMSPFPLTLAWPVTWSTITLPPVVFSCTPVACSTRMSPVGVFSWHEPTTPSTRYSHFAVSPCTSDPVGSSTSTSTEPYLVVKAVRSFGCLTSSFPSANSMLACSAALTSSSQDGSTGRTSTTVSARSLALNPMSPRDDVDRRRDRLRGVECWHGGTLLRVVRASPLVGTCGVDVDVVAVNAPSRCSVDRVGLCRSRGRARRRTCASARGRTTPREQNYAIDELIMAATIARRPDTGQSPC